MSIAARSSASLTIRGDWRKRDVCPGRPPLIASPSVMGIPSGSTPLRPELARRARLSFEQRMDHSD